MILPLSQETWDKNDGRYKNCWQIRKIIWRSLDWTISIISVVIGIKTIFSYLKMHFTLCSKDGRILVLATSFIFCVLTLWHQSLADPKGTAFPRVSWFLIKIFLDVDREKPVRVLFKYKAINPGPTLQLSALSGSHPPALSTTGADTRQLGIVPMPQRPLKVFSLAHLKSVHPASPVLSCRNHQKNSCSQFLPLPLHPDCFLLLSMRFPVVLVAPSAVINKPAFHGNHHLIS